MAYTPIQYTTIDPIKDYLPYDDRYDRDLNEEQKKAELFMEMYYSAPEILKRNQQAAELNQYLLDTTDSLASAITNRDLAGLKSIMNSGNLLLKSAEYKNWVKKSELLSKLMEELRKGGVNTLYSKLYTEADLPDVTEHSTWLTEDLSSYEKLGASIGANLSQAANPEYVGGLLNNSIALLQQGYSYEDALDMLSLNDSTISNTINEVLSKSSIRDPYQLSRIKDAITKGFLTNISQQVATHNNPTYRNPSLVKYERNLEEAQAINNFITNGWNEDTQKELQKYDPEVRFFKEKDKHYVRYKNRDYETDENGMVKRDNNGAISYKTKSSDKPKATPMYKWFKRNDNGTYSKSDELTGPSMSVFKEDDSYIQLVLDADKGIREHTDNDGKYSLIEVITDKDHKKIEGLKYMYVGSEQEDSTGFSSKKRHGKKV